MFSLAYHPETNLLQCTNGVEVVDSRHFGHGYTSTAAFLAPADVANSSITSKYSRIASLMFARASASVAPCEWQPGKPGTETAKPSSDSSMSTVYFMWISRMPRVLFK